MSRYYRDVFESLSAEQRQRRAEELASYLSQRLAAADDFDAEIDRIIESLRDQRHELWSWDYDDGMQIWGPSFQGPRITGLVIEFDAPATVAARWVEGADSSEVRQVFGEGYH